MSTNNSTAEKATLTEDQFCEKVGISTRTAKRWRKRKKLPHVKIGRRVMYLPRHVDEFLKQNERGARA